MDTKIIKKIARDLFRIDKIDYPHTRVMTIAHDTDRSFNYNGKFYSPLIDTLEDDLAKRGVTCISIARIISAIKGERSYASVYSPEGKFARALLQKRFIARFLPKDVYPFSTWEKEAWGKVLDRVQPSSVIGIQPSRELCVACHERGIWVADVQHGVIAQSHPWYGTAFRAKDPHEQVPDAFIVWDEGSAQVLNDWCKEKGSEVIITGNRWLARFMNVDPQDAMAMSMMDRFATQDANSRPTVLLTLSWGETNIPNGFVAPELEAVIKSSATHIRWLIRLHPNQINGFATDEHSRFVRYFDESLSGCAEWETATFNPLPVVLSKTDAHISWASSVAIEAAQMGVRTALLNPRLRDPKTWGDYYGHYRDAGYIDLVDAQVETIDLWLKKNFKSKRSPQDYRTYDEAYLRLLDVLALGESFNPESGGSH